jgi:methylated-DNA-[protein]-cysteine S-methyltransferase
VVKVDWIDAHEEVGPERVDLGSAGDAQAADTAPAPGQLETARLWAQRAAEELEAYMAGRLREFTVPLVLQTGTPFQRAVWQALRSIPYGETRSYLDIAAAVGNPRAVRAVGQANRANPLPIFIPCHRVIGRRGDLVGYAGQQVHLKAALLDLERRGQAEGQLSSACGG